MRTTPTSTVAALSVVLLVSFTITNCMNSRPSTASGYHNMGVGPKDNEPMPDTNMPRKR
jgi:hypothetical protein